MKKTILYAILAVFSTLVQGKNVDFVIAWSPGGITSPAGIVVQEQLKQELKTKINPVLAHRPGAGGQIGVQSVAAAQPGTTHILIDGAGLVTAPLINPIPGAAPVDRNLIPVGYVGNILMVLVVGTHLPVKDFDEFVKYCQNNYINFGSGGIGSSTHLAAEVFLKTINCKSTHIPFQGHGPAIAALIGGHIDMMITTDGVANAYLENQKIKVLGVFGTDRSTLLTQIPQLPTEIKIPTIWVALFVNANAPPDDITLIKNALSNTLKNPTVIEKLKKQGLVNIGRSIPKNWIQKEQNYYLTIIKTININAK